MNDIVDQLRGISEQPLIGSPVSDYVAQESTRIVAQKAIDHIETLQRKLEVQQKALWRAYNLLQRNVDTESRDALTEHKMVIELRQALEKLDT